MARTRERRFSMFHVLFLAAPLLAACSGALGSTDPDDDGGGAQTASATATPSSGTITRGIGGTGTSTTVVISVTGGLAMGPTAVSKPHAGITVGQNTGDTNTGSSRTGTYLFAASPSVPTGNHAIQFSAPILGYTGSGAAPTARATFTLTVN